MTSAFRSSLLGIALALSLALGAPLASAQATFRACRVPGVGAIYMIGVTGVPSACLDASHVEFQWTETGGTVVDGAITTAKLADDAVTSVKIADGTIATVDVADVSITAAKLSPTAVSNGHLGTGTASAATFLRGDRSWGSVAAVVTQFVYNTQVNATSTGTPTLFRPVGTFTKVSAATVINATWTSTVFNANSATSEFCQFQIRIDGSPPPGRIATDYGATVYGAHSPVISTGRWTGLTAGTHTVAIYLRGLGGSCSDAYLGFQAELMIEEVL